MNGLQCSLKELSAFTYDTVLFVTRINNAPQYRQMKNLCTNVRLLIQTPPWTLNWVSRWTKRKNKKCTSLSSSSVARKPTLTTKEERKIPLNMYLDIPGNLYLYFHNIGQHLFVSREILVTLKGYLSRKCCKYISVTK